MRKAVSNDDRFCGRRFFLFTNPKTGEETCGCIRIIGTPDKEETGLIRVPKSGSKEYYFVEGRLCLFTMILDRHIQLFI